MVGLVSYSSVFFLFKSKVEACDYQKLMNDPVNQHFIINFVTWKLGQSLHFERTVGWRKSVSFSEEIPPISIADPGRFPQHAAGSRLAKNSSIFSPFITQPPPFWRCAAIFSAKCFFLEPFNLHFPKKIAVGHFCHQMTLKNEWPHLGAFVTWSNA